MIQELVKDKSSLIPIIDWGLIDYEKSNKEQQKLVKEINEIDLPGALIFCSHNPLVTVGRATKDSDVHSWEGPVLKTPRGGRATYHGPNQLVIYPIINLNHSGFIHFKKRDVTNYLRLLEKSVIETLIQFNIKAYQRCEKVDYNGEKLEATGVWVGDKKIASIGIAVRKWVTYHGIAINVFADPGAFHGINPCGFSADTMTSIEVETGQEIDVEKLKRLFQASFNKLFT